MKAWITRNKLHFRITAILIGILGILGIVYVAISGFTARKYLDEFQQLLYGGLADSTVSQVQPFVDGAVDTLAIQDIMHSIMVINPSAEVYLLDTTGAIVTYMAPHKKIKLDRVSMGPIRSYLAPDRPRIVKGDDPRYPGESKIFSVASIEDNGRMSGYLYVILASEDQQAVASSLFESYFFRLGTRFFFLALVVALVIGSLAIWYLTKKLSHISGTVRRFKEGDLEARIENPEGDWKELAETFNEMADTINQNIESLQLVESLRRELIANVSHDLRTPLSILRGYIETLQIKPDLGEEDRRRYLNIAHQSAEKLSRLISQLFEFSKLEAEQIKPEKEPFQIAELVHDTMQKYQLIAEEKKIKMEVDLPAALPLVFADVSLVERAIQNLIDNALQYTPDGGTVLIKLHHEDESVEVCISDNGPGIPDTEQAFIFERYSKSKNASSGSKGAGLGLAIVKKIMDLHDATIRVQSKLHHGTSFMFRLPAYQV